MSVGSLPVVTPPSTPQVAPEVTPEVAPEVVDEHQAKPENFIVPME